MDHGLTKSLEQQIHAFTKYARFIADKFDVTIEFDGLNAHTNGQTITLPNLLGLSPREIDFLYGVLLHEVGHIKYSDFSKASFALIKTQNHFAIANSIEDARIENLLMQEYDGAEDLISQLYNDFLMDEKFQQKILKTEGRKLNLFAALTSYLHHRIIKLKQVPNHNAMLSKAVAKQLAEFVKLNKIDKLVDNAPLRNWTDVVELSNQIYDLFFDQRKDTSDANQIPQLEANIQEILADHVSKVEAKLNKVQQATEKLRSKIAQVQARREEFQSQNGQRVAEVAQAQNQLESQIDRLDETLSTEKSLEKLAERETKHLARQAKKEQQIAELNSKIDQLQEKFMAGDTAVENKLKQALKKHTEAQKQWQNLQDNLAKIQKEKAEDAAALNKMQAPGSLPGSKAEREELLNKMNGEYQALDQEARKYDNQDQSLRAEQQKLQQELKEIQNEHNQEIVKELRKMQTALEDSGLPVSGMGGSAKTPGWADADSCQQAFDDEASAKTGKLVTAGLGAGNRDILMMVTQAKTELQAIDVAEIFKQTNGVSKLDYLNSASSIRNTQDRDGSVADFSNQRKHLPLTTMFDRVVIKNSLAAGSDLAKIRAHYSATGKRLTDLMRRKLKAQRKDKFKGNQEEGNLDSRNLWKLATGTDDNYFEIAQSRQINQVAASIALDISGSMDKSYTAQGKKLRELALLLSDALKACYVKHEICGYHAPVSHEMRDLKKANVYNRSSNCLETVVYRKFNDQGNGGLSNLELQCTDNSDGESIKIIAQRLIRERGRRRVLFVISDGKPWLSDADAAILDQDLAQTLTWCEQNKVEVIGLGFNEEGAYFYKRFMQVQAKDYSDVLAFLEQVL